MRGRRGGGGGRWGLTSGAAAFAIPLGLEIERGIDEGFAVGCEVGAGGGADGDDEIKAGGDGALFEAEGLADQALDAIADHGGADASADGKAEA